ncbi:MAG: hypothetical protein KGS48_11420, partial [Bacteroidetes bacterium]|nr:hypothetical protein [Bacteroidota bacterium]
QARLIFEGIAMSYCRKNKCSMALKDLPFSISEVLKQFLRLIGSAQDKKERIHQISRNPGYICHFWFKI